MKNMHHLTRERERKGCRSPNLGPSGLPQGEDIQDGHLSLLFSLLSTGAHGLTSHSLVQLRSIFIDCHLFANALTESQLHVDLLHLYPSPHAQTSILHTHLLGPALPALEDDDQIGPGSQQRG